MIFRPTFEEGDHPGALDPDEIERDKELWDEVPDEEDPTDEEEEETPTAAE